jgi:hypothetical protein
VRLFPACESRDFLAAKRRAETEVLLPVGAKIAFSGGLDFNDHRLIWESSKANVKYPDFARWFAEEC